MYLDDVSFVGPVHQDELVAFYKSAPMWDAVFIISLIVPYWIFKILFALLDTPFVYLGVWWLRGKKNAKA